jgi:hypothetical protein
MLVRVTLARGLCNAARPLLIVGIACGAAAARAGGPPLPSFEPDPQVAENLTLSGTTWTREEPTHVVHLRQVDAQERLRYIEGATGLSVDPFAAPAGEDPRFTSFLIVIENRGDTPLSFNALNCWLTTNRQQIETPLGLTDLSFDYQLMGLELPAAYAGIAPLMLEGTRTLAPGDSLSGLLVYHAVDARTRRFHVDVELTMPSGDEVRLRAPYRRPRPAPAAGAPAS